KSIFEFFTKRHMLATLFTLMVLLLGISSLRNIKRDLYPAVDFGVVEITTTYPGASPEDVELNVTNKIEDQLKNVTGIDRITSTSLENMSMITVTLEAGLKNPQKTKDDIHDAVGRVTDLPDEVTESPFILDVDTSWINIIEVGLSGDLPYKEMREMAKQLEKKLKAVPGVKMLVKYGYRAREIKVEVVPRAMDHYQIPLREILQAIQARNIRMTGGTFESFTSEKNVMTLAQFKDPAEVGNVIVRSTFEGPLIRVRDLAVVKDEFEKENVISHMEGRKAISFIVFKSGEADIIKTAHAIKEVIRKETEKQMFAPGGGKDEVNIIDMIKGLFIRERKDEKMYWFKYGNVQVLYSADQSVYVESQFKTVSINFILGLGFVLLILTIFLQRRTAFWVAMGIPVSILGVIFLLPMFGAFLDILSLTSMILVIGIIVDDGIIISENIYRHRELGESPLKAAVEGTKEVFFPVLTTVLTTCLVFVPMFFMTGMIGKFVYVIPLVVILALIISLIESVVALPAHIKRGLEKTAKKTKKTKGRELYLKVKERFRRLSIIFLKLRYPLVILFIAVLAGTLWYARSSMEFVLFPDEAEEYFRVDIELPAGTSLAATEQKVFEIEKLIKELPKEELETFVSRIGKTENGGMGEHLASILVGLTPFSERTRTAHEVVEEMRRKAAELEGIPKIVFEVSGGGPPAGRPIDMRVIGSDDIKRKELADQVEEFIKKMDGVKDLNRDDRLGKEQVEIKIDYNKLARLGLTVADIAQNVRVAFDGQAVTTFRDGDEDVEFRVQLLEEARKDVAYLYNLSIPNNQGRLIKLREVAGADISPGPTAFQHFDGERAISITGDMDKDKITPLAVINAVFEHFNMEEDWPGIQLIVGGEAEESEKAVVNLAGAFLIAAIGIYFLLVLLFNSFTQPIFVMVAIPFGIIGVIVAFALHGEPLGFFAMIGTIGLSGVVVNDSLVLVDHLNALTREKPGANIIELVAEGTSNRLRPILLTTLTTVVGLLPLAYGVGGGDTWMSPMALALGYGLVFATPLTLILVPCLYTIRDDIAKFLKRKDKEKPPVVAEQNM
ncbi:MAG TPA: efflux RND transporter permease subunit, partial [Spirochaetia bacterium]|nr:efflux RND transporter permease subunit [Spirochaetia bacterium]